MKLAKNINIKQYPAFAALDKNRLVALIQIADEQSVKGMLAKNNIKIDIDENSGRRVDKFKVGEFKKNIDKFIEIKTIPKKITAACKILEKYTDIIIENPKAIKGNPDIIESSKAMVKKLKNMIALQSKNLLE